MRKGWRYFITTTVITAVLLTGCSSGSGSTSQNQQATESTAEGSAESTAENTEGMTAVASATSQVVVDTEYKANDLDVGYEDSTATHITLKDNNIKVSGEGASAKESLLTISEEGTYVITGTLTDGQIIVEADEKDKVQLVLDGVSVTSKDFAPIYIKNADKVYLTLAENTENNLTDGAEYVQIDENTVDGVIYSTSDLTINGKGTISITGNYKHGIVSKDDLVITGGIFNITAVKDTMNGKDCVKINDGTFTLNAGSDGIESKNDEDSTKGYVYISGGSITIADSEEGIEGTAIVIEGGNIDVTAQDDGLNASSGSSSSTEDSAPTKEGTSTQVLSTEAASETAVTTLVSTTSAGTADNSNTDTTVPDATSSATINENGGEVPMPDGSTQAPGSDAFGNFKGGRGGAFENDTNSYISISGGTVTVNASGDGIDSNGSVYISGGTVYVSGPTNDGNAGLDNNGTADITGGTVIVAGSSGMAQGFSETSTQYSLLNNFTTAIEAGTEVKLIDQNGNVILSYTPDKQYQSVVISTPELKKGETYTLTCGSQTAEITLSSVATTSGQQGMSGFGNRPSRGGAGGMVKPDFNTK